MNELTIICLWIFGVLKSLWFHNHKRTEFGVFLRLKGIGKNSIFYYDYGLIISWVTTFQR